MTTGIGEAWTLVVDIEHSQLVRITHNPWVVLQTVSRDQIERVLADPIFLQLVFAAEA